MILPDGSVKYMLEVHNDTIDKTTHVQILKKSFDGLVPAARKWWNLFKEVLATCDYYPSKSYHCQENASLMNHFICHHIR
jgi:hypothetical protein